MQPLSGLLVLDFTSLLPGPLATLMLAEAGAEVIKIEPYGGEAMRSHPPLVEDQSAAFALLNRGKKSLMLDLKTAQGRARLAPLLARADVLVEQYRPGVMRRLDLDYAAVRKNNPDIIYCSISGYGQSGPRAQEAGHDLNYIGSTGLLALNPGCLDRPTVPPALIADIGGGTFPAVLNILLALRQRDATGQGCYLDIAMADAMFTFAWHGLANGFAAGHFPAPGEDLLVGGSPRYRLYPTRDQQLVACAALEQKFWQAFCQAIDLPQRYALKTADPQAASSAVAAIIANRSGDEWRPIFAAADCCVTIVASLAEAVCDPQFVARGLFAHQLDFAGRKVPALPVPIGPQFRDATGVAKSWPRRRSRLTR